jgi:hypothetical protein
MSVSKHATVPRDGFSVPIIGIPESATDERCDGCGDFFHLTIIKLWRGQFLCSYCLAKRLNHEAEATARSRKFNLDD